MHIGLRRVRSAGRASGSIEITLPPELTPLEGIVCNILVRDGARPEIVLKPELTPAALIFARVWSRLRFLLRLAGEIGEFPIAEVDVSLLPPATNAQMGSTAGRPALVYAFALTIGQALVVRWPASSADFSVHVPSEGLSDAVENALVGVIHPLASVAAVRLGLVGDVASNFGDVVALLSLPRNRQPHGSDMADSRFEITWSRQTWLESCDGALASLGILAAQPNDATAQAALLRIVSQFREWQEYPSRRQAARIDWLAQIPDWFMGVSRPISAR